MVIVVLLAFLAPNVQAEPIASADDLLLVDCKLPAKTRRVGGRTIMMGGRPVRTTAVDCRIRGGEYTVYDRANYATSLEIWLAEAKKGNADAQYYVGKIYEGGLGTTPDYKAAASWYEKAAATGHSASQYSLGNLYEKGLGVSPDSNKAFNLYRKAAGLPGDYKFVESSEYDALQKAAQDLALREQQVDDLQRQLDAARKQQKRDEQRERELMQQLDQQKKQSEEEKKELARVQTLLRAGPQPVFTKDLTVKKGTLGRFYALVIGNGQYQSLPPVPTAERDAKALATLLKDSYGFQVTLLQNATNRQILSALYDLSQELAENDNLVVFYAGHGKRDLRNRRGWWLPVDAQPDGETRANWLPNQEVSDRLALVPARHILVLADASYVGDIVRGAPLPEPDRMTVAQWNKYVDAARQKKSRLALASGADGPIGSSEGSRFTKTLIDVLSREKGVVPASRVHRQLVTALTADDRVSSAIPTLTPLQSAFHDGVDFLFERK
jgi:hypothetical protein